MGSRERPYADLRRAITAIHVALLVVFMVAVIVLATVWRSGFNAGARAHADGKVVVTGSGVHQREVERGK